VAAGHEVLPFAGVGFEGHAFVHALPIFGSYLFVPRGPVIDPSRLASEELRDMLSESARVSRAGWIRVEPQTEEALGILKQAYGAYRVVAAPRDINPRETFMVSLDGGPADWLIRMKPKTRYNVRLAEKHGVTVRFSRSADDMETFLGLITSTANRKAIAPHPKAYYRNFLTALPETMCEMAIAEYQGVSVAAALLVFFEETAHYLHGGSGDAHRELMAPFLLHFKAMEEAKRRGARRYDFGGVRVRAKKGANDIGWDGITRFKQGFVPDMETLLFPGTYDIIVSPVRYMLYRQSRHLAGVRYVVRNILSRLSS
jgi:lipid II:glycine glycyltransferase (peptidoglycan interpeptide bridge formation enzyme)